MNSFSDASCSFLCPDGLADAAEADPYAERFQVETVAVLSSPGLDPALEAVMGRQRLALLNATEGVRVHSHGVREYEARAATPGWSGLSGPPREVHMELLDANVRRTLAELRLDPTALAEMGLVVCGGLVLESAMSAGHLTRVEVSRRGDEQGFDVDLFVTSCVPHKGCIENYAAELVEHLRGDADVAGVELGRRGFCMDADVRYVDGSVVKMQIVDLGVPASAMAIVGSFDVAPARMYYCASAGKVVMTEDAAYAMCNRVIPFDRRFVEDPRYPSRIRKYCARTGFPLALDRMGAAAARFAEGFAARTRRLVATPGAMDAAASMMEDLPACDASVLAIAAVSVGRGSPRGYATKRRTAVAPIIGSCGRFNLKPLGAPQAPICEFYAMFLLNRIVSSLEELSIPEEAFEDPGRPL